MGKKLVDPNKLCMGCMALLDNIQKPCPKCGFLITEYRQPADSMPLYEILNGKYLVGKVIGIGGFGITYIGWDFYQSKRVCIKEYFPKGVAARDPNASVSTQYSTCSMDVFTKNTQQAKYAYMGGLQSYIKEAGILSKFYLMPGIVSVRDFFYGNKTAYIVMEYIEGINLRQFAKACGGRIAADYLFQLLKDVIKALNAVHKAGVVHRDISPDNIMINQQYQAKVIDFGAAKNYNNMQEKSILLKHGYAPIEQYDRNGNQGPWTDVYSLCATMYYLLSGVKLQKSYERIAQDFVVPLQSRGVSISMQQDKVILKGLSIQIEDRYQTMAELYYDLYQECLPGETPPQEQGKRNEGQRIEELDPTVPELSREEAARAYLEQHLKQENEKR